jgi:hypothetical protein
MCMYVCTHVGTYAYHMHDSKESFRAGWNAHVVLWRPEALDCRVLMPPETCN